jgi:MFS family permease
MFSIGFILLFVFVSTFTYANFVLSRAPFELPQLLIGLVYFVFVPAILTTPMAATSVRRYGTQASFLLGIGVSLFGLLCLLSHHLSVFMVGLSCVGAGLFFAQSVATGHVGRIAKHDHAAANGVYLACYYLGGITGTFVIGQIFETFGWTSAIYTLAGLTSLAGVLSIKMKAG